MEIIKSNIVIGNALIEINKNIVSFEDIYLYEKILRKKIKTEKISDESIYSFCKNYSYLVKIQEKNKITLNTQIKTKSKLIKFFREVIPEKLRYLFIIESKFIFPIISNNKFIIYYVSSNSKKILDLKNNLNLENNIDGYTIIDLNLLSNFVGVSELKNFVNYFFIDSNLIKKDEFKLIDIEEIINSMDIILNSNGKFRSKEILAQDKEILLRYYNLSKSNADKLNGSKIVFK